MTVKEPLLVDLEIRKEFSLADTLWQCYQCGTCTASCPLNQLRDSDNKITVRKIFHQAQLGLPTDKLVWDCSSCKLCETRCPRQVEIVENFKHIRKFGYKRREMPVEFEKLLWNILEEANPSGEPRAKRGDWASGLNLKQATQGTEYLFYVGGPESYDPRLSKVAKQFSSMLTKWNIDFGILGKQEPTSGEAVREIGDFAYLEYVIEQNVKQFNEIGMKKIVVLSPHAYDIMKHIYPDYGLEAEVLHYTQLLDEIWNSNKLEIKEKINGEITYHDPCFLGRYNGVYEQPRNILEAIGLEIIEMKDSKSSAICCGGGGNQMYRESEDGERISDKRVLQAADTGTFQLVTACGYCIQNFEDSTKVTGSDLVVLDVLETVNKAMFGGGK